MLYCPTNALTYIRGTVPLRIVNHTHTHSRSEYAAITLTTYVSTRRNEQDFNFI